MEVITDFWMHRLATFWSVMTNKKFHISCIIICSNAILTTKINKNIYNCTMIIMNVEALNNTPENVYIIKLDQQKSI